MNINRIDLNLFAVFDAIYTAGSLTKAADVLCITQPAVSNSLSRLREMLNDPLFVRTGHTMTPTPAAQNIIGPARQALKMLRQSVQESHKFDPKGTEKNFSFSMRDLLEASFFPRLLNRLQDSAPNISLTNHLVSRDKIVSAMASGHLDFHADGVNFTDPHLCKELIAQDRYIVVARKNHPALTQGLTLDTFLSLGHINVSQRPKGLGHVDSVLSKMGLTRRVIMRSQHVMTVPSEIVKTDLISCLPYHFAKHFDLSIYELPFDIDPLEYYLYWHVSADLDQSHLWMREQLLEVAKVFTPSNKPQQPLNKTLQNIK
jgi:DNA-binding transcriptional LysR family regulator